MKYSVVMPCLLSREQHRDVVMQTIRSVKHASEDFELIIVDDGSTLPAGFLKSEAGTYIRHNPKNRGIAPSWNDGKNVARGEFVAIINDDIMVPDGWLDTMSKAFDMFNSCGVSLIKEAGPHAVPELIGSAYDNDYKWPSGYCFMLKKDRYFKDFDEQFVPFNFEDIDYWETLMGQGYRLIKSPVRIWHAEGDTIHSMRYEETDNENLQKFINKWGFNPKNKYFGV